MKILKKEGVYRKVPNDWIADDLVKKWGWEYSTRSEWKQNVRDIKKQEKSEEKNIHKKIKERKNHKKTYEKNI